MDGREKRRDRRGERDEVTEEEIMVNMKNALLSMIPIAITQ